MLKLGDRYVANEHLSMPRQLPTDIFWDVSDGHVHWVCYLPPKRVSRVLSVDTMSGTIVAPGHCDSSNSWLRSSVPKLKEYHVTHLYRPPPITCIHLTVHPLHLLTVHIVSLGSKNQIPCKFRIAVDCADGMQGV